MEARRRIPMRIIGKPYRLGVDRRGESHAIAPRPLGVHHRQVGLVTLTSSVRSQVETGVSVVSPSSPGEMPALL